jgi:hypothetical protein
MRFKKISYLLLGFGTMHLLGCSQTPQEISQAKVIHQMEWLYSAKPDRDFQSAIGRKDYRFLGLYGYALYVPRVDASCITSANDVKPIEGTSDVVNGYEHEKLIAIAGVYASDFNLMMLMYRIKNQGFKCGS